MDYKIYKYYGCLLCQCFHYEDEEVYSKHMTYQSRHGVELITQPEREIVRQIYLSLNN